MYKVGNATGPINTVRNCSFEFYGRGNLRFGCHEKKVLMKIF